MDTTTMIVLIIAIVAMLVFAGITLYLYLRDTKLDDIRKDVYQLFLKAEHYYEESGSGKQKMKWVIQSARTLLPKWLQAILTDEFMEVIIQVWFDSVKDLLDDGKYNHSGKKEE